MWTPCIRQLRATGILRALIAFTVLCSPAARAEDASVPASVELVQPTPAPQQPPADRKDGSGAAIALAAAGAAIAGMSCAMLMKQAKEATTESEKNMLMMMAMQQCSQAAQTLANAAQNQKGKDGLTSPAAPGAPQLKSEAQPTKEAKAEPTLALPQTEATQAVAEIATPTPAAATETASGVVSPEVFNKAAAPEGKPQQVASGPSSSVPKVIPKNGVEFDDNAKVGQGSTTSFGQPNLLGQGGAPQAPAAANKDLKQLLTDAREITGRKNKNAGADTHGDGSGGSSEGKDSKGNEGDMSAMLAQLMGGGASAGGDAGGPSNQVMNLKAFAKANGGDEGEELPNVFQYASFRYRQLNQERAVKVFTTEQAPVALTEPKVAPARVTKKLVRGKSVAMRAASQRRGSKR